METGLEIDSEFLLPQIAQIFTDMCGLCLFVETGLEIDSEFLLPQIAQIFTDVCGLCLCGIICRFG